MIIDTALLVALLLLYGHLAYKLSCVDWKIKIICEKTGIKLNPNTPKNNSKVLRVLGKLFRTRS